MIILDKALKKRQEEGNPIRVALVGAGFIGQGIALQILTAMKGIRLVAISNRTLSKANKAYEQAGADSIKTVETLAQLNQAIADKQYAVTDDPMLLCEADQVEAIMEATGDVELAAQVAMKAIQHGKHYIMNAELDTTLGPVLKHHADQAGVVISNTDGDQPGVIMNLYRFVESIGCRPVLAGNIKSFLDVQATPDSQIEYAAKFRQNPRMVTSFADGTKISMEMAVVANATGFHVGKRGMYGPRCGHVTDSTELFPMDKLLNGGLVDYIIGAEPSPGVFVLGYNEHPTKQFYMQYFKMGKGPLYVFYTPYHLTHLEMPLTTARAVLFQDAALEPIKGPVCDVIAVAKTALKAGQRLDGIGGYTCYGTIVNSIERREGDFLPMGLSGGCIAKHDLPAGQTLTFDDVELPEGRLSDILWAEQKTLFNGS